MKTTRGVRIQGLNSAILKVIGEFGAEGATRNNVLDFLAGGLYPDISMYPVAKAIRDALERGSVEIASGDGSGRRPHRLRLSEKGFEELRRSGWADISACAIPDA